MVGGFGIDKLHVHPNSVTAALYRALKHIADVQLAPDLPYIYRSALVREGAVAGDNEQTADARQIRRQGLGDTIDEIFLFAIASDIRKRQHDDRKSRRGNSDRRAIGQRTSSNGIA